MRFIKRTAANHHAFKEDHSDVNPKIGCIVLTNPIFFRKEDWVAIPENWKPSTQQGKSYSTDGKIEVSKRIKEEFENGKDSTTASMALK